MTGTRHELIDATYQLMIATHHKMTGEARHKMTGGDIHKNTKKRVLLRPS